MIRSFQENKDIYSFIASIAFNMSYEDCLEFNPTTGAYQPEGKARRSESKSVVLGILYGRSINTIADQLYSHMDWSDEKKLKQAQYVYDSVLNAFPALRKLMINAQRCAKEKGYVETILGRRRHIPEMQLPEFEFRPLKGYANPDIDPLDASTLDVTDDIPDRVKAALYRELKSYKYFGQVAKRIRALAEEDHIKVINNNRKIADGSRQCVNCVDTETEILTTSGWKRYNQVSVGDSILSYSMNLNCITRDKVQAVHIYPGEHEVFEFKSNAFSAVSTPNHRWVCQAGNKGAKFVTTEHIMNIKWVDPPILRMSDNNIPESSYSDDFIKLIGWIATDGTISSKHYCVRLYQDTKRAKGAGVYQDMISVLHRLGIKYTDNVRNNTYHDIYLYKCDVTLDVLNLLENRTLKYEFVSSLSERQANILISAMIQGDGWTSGSQTCYTCNSAEKADIFQYLCVIGGHVSHMYKIDPTESSIHYGNVSNPSGYINTKNPYYLVYINKRKRAHIYPDHKSASVVDTVWCVTTGNGTWIARRNGSVYITGNSIIQGSAADLTKLAMLKVENNPEWNKIGGRVLVPVHDELIAEVPIDKWKEGGEILSSSMCSAANFLPFSIKCDVTTTYRWYGLEYPCRYKQPSTVHPTEKDEIAWIQYHLFEVGYDLPVYKTADGGKPEGDEALGVNGVWSDTVESDMLDYCNRYNITEGEFLEHIHTKVHTGYAPGEKHV